MQREYLLVVTSRYFASAIGEQAVVSTHAGVRPIVKRRRADFSRASREAAMERRGRVFSVFGGKWTSACTLGEAAAEFTLGELRRDHGLH